ncbi:hypothetical protein SLEP1_g14708 [Rubroshorea leprosula]|uniref:non-specific serine/threonine protein kinase n=1 Tax=Rubroshorea leprosula TaxID=152421 RepID=A0AAV5IUF2_9ROSI|nr:hypothetical protein SLEP1_g14708 [Rubroshorea leprosula]
MENKGSVLMQKYEVGRLLGQGTFAKVHYARNLETGMSVAIKIVDKEKVLKVGMIDQIKQEISLMKLVRHPNMVELYEVMASKTKIYFVMEYAKGGELFNKVAKGKLKEDAARKYFQQLICAVDYCHSRGVCHRDLKPENLLLDEQGNLKVSDFGLSALAQSKHQDGLLHTTCGTPAYVAPEVINRRGYDGFKADVWSCGVILYVLLAGYLPFRDSNLMELYRKIGKGEFKFPNWFAPEVRRLISKILDPNPSSRISMAKIMENPWFRRGLETPKPPLLDHNEKDSKELAALDADAVFSMNENPNDAIVEANQEVGKPSNLNAFDIISMSSGFDLSGLFAEGKDERKKVQFTSNKTASTIISKLEDIARRLKLKVKKKDGGLLKMEGSKEGRKGALGIDAEIFEITPFFHLVEMKKSNGDTLEYQKMMKQDIRPALKDIVWTWKGEPPPPQPPLPPLLQQQPQQLDEQ